MEQKKLSLLCRSVVVIDVKKQVTQRIFNTDG